MFEHNHHCLYLEDAEENEKLCLASNCRHFPLILK